jgi:hypothetical protein
MALELELNLVGGLKDIMRDEMCGGTFCDAINH